VLAEAGAFAEGALPSGRGLHIAERSSIPLAWCLPIRVSAFNTSARGDLHQALRCSNALRPL